MYYFQDEIDRGFVRAKLMDISGDTQLPPGWMSEWK